MNKKLPADRGTARSPKPPRREEFTPRARCDELPRVLRGAQNSRAVLSRVIIGGGGPRGWVDECRLASPRLARRRKPWVADARRSAPHGRSSHPPRGDVDRRECRRGRGEERHGVQPPLGDSPGSGRLRVGGG